MPVGYTRGALAAAVRASATLSEAITRLGRAPTSGRRVPGGPAGGGGEAVPEGRRVR